MISSPHKLHVFMSLAAIYWFHTTAGSGQIPAPGYPTITAALVIRRVSSSQLAARLHLPVALIDTAALGIQATPGSPRSQPFDRLSSRGSHGDDVLGSSRQRHVQQRRQTAAGTDFGTRPLVVPGLGLVGIQIEKPQVNLSDLSPLFAAGQVEEEAAVEPLGTGKLRRQLGNIVAGANREHVALVVVEPREERTEKAWPRRRCHPNLKRRTGPFPPRR